MGRKSLLGGKTNTQKQLEIELTDASQKYYTDGTSPLTDAEFDNKLQQLKNIDPESPVVTNVGHGYKVSGDNTYGVKVPHRYGLVGSLDKVHNWKELSKCFKDGTSICTLKLDGISCVLYYVDSVLDQAVTRGDGTVGVDITEKFRVICPKAETITSFDWFDFRTGAIRGELIMSYDNFEKFKKDHDNAKNPRNTVAGLINQKEWSKEELELIDFIPYSIMGTKNKIDYGDMGYLSVFPFLARTFGDHVPMMGPYGFTEENLIDTMAQLNVDLHEDFNYPSDGIVIDGIPIEQTWDESKQVYIHSWESEAFKFPSEVKTTTVREVLWKLTKTGHMVPRLKFDEVQLAGTSVNYATAFNAKYVQDTKIGVDSVIKVTKSGEIIPYVMETVSVDESKFELPTYCPSCGEELELEGAHLQCCNPNCPSKSYYDTLIWIKTVAPVDGVSDATIEEYMDALNISCVADVYNVLGDDSKKHVISGIVKYHRGQLFMKALEGCYNNEISVTTAIRACNIPRFGEKNSEKLEGHYDYIVDQLNNHVVDGVPEWNNIDSELSDIGDANLVSLLNCLHKLDNLLFIKDQIVKTEKKDVLVKGDVCITGKLSMKRSDMEKVLIEHGFNPVKSVKKDTLYLVTNTPDSGSSKNKTADKYGVKKITEEELYNIW